MDLDPMTSVFHSPTDRKLSVVDLLAEQARAKKKLDQKYKQRSPHKFSDDLYASYLTLRTVPVATFFSETPREWQLPITSINEDMLLKQLDVPRAERHQIEGLMTATTRGQAGVADAQLSRRAIIDLATNPPPRVGYVQQLTARWLLRPFPLGYVMPLQTSNKNVPF